jgi:hypothetical protein
MKALISRDSKKVCLTGFGYHAAVLAVLPRVRDVRIVRMVRRFICKEAESSAKESAVRLKGCGEKQGI